MILAPMKYKMMILKQFAYQSNINNKTMTFLNKKPLYSIIILILNLKLII